MSRVGLLLSLLFAALVAHLVTMLDFHPDQDQCTFGPVSNEHYRELLLHAQLTQRQRWPLVIWNAKALERLVRDQFQEMTATAPTAYERIATMHAIYRAMGADFLYTQPSNDPFSQIADQGGAVNFGYQINVNRLAAFYPLGRTGWFIGSLAGPRRSGPGSGHYDRDYPQGSIRFITYYPNPFDPIPDVLRRGASSCPAVPNVAIEPFFRPQAK